MSAAKRGVSFSFLHTSFPSSFQNSSKFLWFCQCHRLELPLIGQPRKLTIGHNNKGPSPDWHLELVEVVEESSGKRYLFPCNKWLAVGMEDGRLERTLRLSEVDPRVNKSEYKVGHVQRYHRFGRFSGGESIEHLRTTFRG